MTRQSGAVDQAAFETVMRDNLSPAGIATVIAFLRAGDFYQPASDTARSGLDEAGWLADTLIEMLGVDTYNDLIEELGL